MTNVSDAWSYRFLESDSPRKTELEALIATTDEPPALLHPKMAEHYRAEVARLHEALTDEKHRHEAAEIIRSLVEKIVLNPAPEGSDAAMTIDLHGDLAGILSLSAQTKKPPRKGGDFTESNRFGRLCGVIGLQAMKNSQFARSDCIK